MTNIFVHVCAYDTPDDPPFMFAVLLSQCQCLLVVVGLSANLDGRVYIKYQILVFLF